MTMPSDFRRAKKFVPDVLPWLIAAAALLVYLLTLNHWITLYSLNYVSQVAGWAWPQNSLPPLYFIATYPVRWLPPGALPVALNLFSAVCAALTLGLLARSVALLPHDRTQAQREREPSEFSFLTMRMAWLPVVFAVVAGGLQLTFWENAVAGTSEMLDLLLLAYVIRCLLEFRIDRRDSWLFCAALVFGAAMTENWLMVALLPLFGAVIGWLKGIRFFNLRFLASMAGLGLAGTLFYLLMPLVQSHTAGAAGTYWQILHFNLGMQKNILLHLPIKALWVMGLTSFLPLFVLSIRWAASFGDNSPLGVALASFMFHLVHGMFLFACLWVAFDPPFSPRIFPRQYHYGASWLTFYYLGALCIGYYSGYFLLIFGEKSKAQGRPTSWQRLVNPAVLAAIWLLLLVAVVGLLYKNLPQIRAANGGTLRTFASLLVKNLPPQNAVVLADNPQVLLLAEAALPSGWQRHIFLNTSTLPYPAYQRYLREKHPGEWPAVLGTNQAMRTVPPRALIQTLARLAENHDIFYLHPSFGYYFEQFYPEAHGLVYQLKLYPTNAIVPPPPTPENLAENNAFWQRDYAGFFATLNQPVVENKKPGNVGFGQAALQYFQLHQDDDLHKTLAGIMSSRALDCWGVALQQNKQISDAAWAFQRAQELNRHNVSAELSLAYNQTCLQTTNSAPFKITKVMEDKLAGFRSWDETLNANGPVDEPQFCLQEGQVFANGKLFRQAAQLLLRAKELSPNNIIAYLWLAQIYNLWHLSDPALDLVHTAHELPATATVDRNVEIGLISIEATAYFNKNKPEIAEHLLETALAAFPNDDDLLNAVLRLYIAYQLPKNALAIVDHQLDLNPDSTTALNNKGFIFLQMRKYDLAVPPLDHVLALQPNNSVALLNRAIAHLQIGQLDEAKQDYEALQILLPKAFQVYYGLGEIAYRQKDTKTARANYQHYLAIAPPNTPEWKTVTARVAELKNTPP